jgi:hypothetical protein
MSRHITAAVPRARTNVATGVGGVPVQIDALLPAQGEVR